MPRRLRGGRRPPRELPARVAKGAPERAARPTLRTHTVALTPDGVQVPQPPKSRLRSQLAALPHIEALPRSQRQGGAGPRRPRPLDGFLLLEACRAELPADAERAELCEMRLQETVEEDLAYFSRLRYLDASRNEGLALGGLGALPAVEEVRLQCNALRDHGPRDLAPGAFARLTALDLAYNRLSGEAIAELRALPRLQSLDLTCNELATLPDMSAFPCLERLVVERNRLEDAAQLFRSVAGAAKLRDLRAAYNFLSGVPVLPPQSGGSGAGNGHGNRSGNSSRSDGDGQKGWKFPLLESVDLAFNLVETEEALRGLLHMPRLRFAYLYGNPLCGPSGEDGTLQCVRNLLSASSEARAGWTGLALQLLTEAPRKRREKRSAARSAYPPPLRSVPGDKGPGGRGAIAAGDTAPGRRAAGAGELVRSIVAAPQATDDAPKDGFFVTGVDAGGFADGAGKEGPAPDTAERDFGEYEAWVNSLSLQVPTSVLRRGMRRARRDSGKLRAAVHALRFALEHPLSSHDDADIPAPPVVEYLEPAGAPAGQGDGVAGARGRFVVTSGGAATGNGAARPTASYHGRALPRKVFVPLAERKRRSARAGAEDRQSKAELAALEKALDAMNAKLARIGASPTAQRKGPGAEGDRMTALLDVMDKVVREMA